MLHRTYKYKNGHTKSHFRFFGDPSYPREQKRGELVQEIFIPDELYAAIGRMRLQRGDYDEI